MRASSSDGITQWPGLIVPPEPADLTFAVWFHANGAPVLIFYRADACTWEGQHWRVAHLDGRTDDPQPQTWAEVCERGYDLRLNGPHLLQQAN